MKAKLIAVICVVAGLGTPFRVQAAPPQLPADSWQLMPVAGDATFVQDDGATPSGTPRGRTWFGMDYMSSAGAVVLFGGSWGAGCGSGYINDVWDVTWDDTDSSWQWNQRVPVNRHGGNGSIWPQGTDNHSVTYDAHNDVLWIFAGTCQNFTASGGWGYYDFASNEFTEVGASANPAAHRPGTRNTSIAWGDWGAAGVGGATQGIWFFSGESLGDVTSVYNSGGSLDINAWIAANPASPPQARKQTEESGVWIPSTKRFLLFGGRIGGNASLDDTWEYDPIANQWTQICGGALGPCGPPCRNQHVMVYDSKNDVVILHGGGGYSNCTGGNNNHYADTWIYRPQTRTWSQLSGANGPTLQLHAAAYDSQNDVMVMWGGLLNGGPGEGGSNNPGLYGLRYSGSGATSPVCGNGAIEDGETCDGANLAGQTCQSVQGAGWSGTLACNSTCNGWVTTGCAPPTSTCGNGAIDAGETCDGANLAGQTCQSVQGAGWSGTLACNSTCNGWVTAGCSGPAPAGGGLVDLTIVEPTGNQPRSTPHVTSGIPLPPGTDHARLSLWDGSTEIPVQVSDLDGTTADWVLLDFQVPGTLGAGATRTLTVKSGSLPAAAPVDPVVVSPVGGTYEIDTGPLKVVLSQGAAWNLFDRVFNDSNGDGQWDQQILTGGSDNIQLTGRINGSTNTTHSGKTAGTTLTWEYGGPSVANAMRATLLVEGNYGTLGLTYAMRLTFYAGKSHVSIEHVIRNSTRFNQTHAKIASATLTLGSGSAAQDLPASGAWIWTQVTGPSGVELELVPPSISGYYSSRSANGGMVLHDLSYHGGTWVVDFDPTPETNAAQVRSPLFATASDRRWYSEHGNLTIGRFGTIEDEQASYSAWSEFTVPGSPAAGDEPALAHEPNYLDTDWYDWSVHEDLENDDLLAHILLYLHMGPSNGRGYWDRAAGWARYYKWEYALRTDGFPYAWDKNWEHNCLGDVARPSQAPSGLTSLDNSALNAMQNGKNDIYTGWGADHMFGASLVDYYHLTGDRDARDAAVDLGELGRRIVPTCAGTGAGIPVVRRWARTWMAIIRAAEVTGDPGWISDMNGAANVIMTATNWRERENWSMFSDGAGTTNSKCSSSSDCYSLGLRTMNYVEGPWMFMSLDRYARSPGAANGTGWTVQDVENRIVGIAEFIYRFGLASATPGFVSPTDDFNGSYFGIDYPNVGDAWHIVWSDVGRPSGIRRSYTALFIHGLVLGYQHSGDARYLNRARYFWHRSSKSINDLNTLELNCGSNYNPATQACRYAQGGVKHVTASPGASFPQNGEILQVISLFADGVNSTGSGAPTTDTSAPTVPSGLSATAVGADRIDLGWSASSDPQSGISHYRVYRNGTLVGQAGGTSYSDTGLAAGTTYTYRISAVNGAGLESGQSSPATATTGAGSPPPPPTGLSVN